MHHRPDPKLDISSWWIATVIRLFPPAFRSEYGSDLLNAFKDQKDDLASSHAAVGARFSVAATTMKVTWHLCRAAYAENHSAGLKRQSQTTRQKEQMLINIIADIKYAVRGFWKQPGFTVVTILTLALGIGACTAIFSVVNGILLTPLPYEHPDQLVSIRVNSGISGSTGYYGPSEPEYWDFRTASRSFADAGALSGMEVTLGDSTGVRRLQVMRMTANTLPMLGVNPLMGRFFSNDEDQPGVGGAIVLSYGMWQSEFGGDQNILGRTLSIDVLDQPLPIVGVMPPGFEFPDDTWEAWAPLQLNREDPWARNNHYLDVLARLNPSMTLEAAQSEMNVLASRSTADFPEYYPDPGLRVQLDTYRTLITGNVATPLFVLLGAVAFVVLMACVNVANLLLARGEARRREIAVRNAVGASSRRLTAQLVTENFLLAAIGGLAGLGVAFLGTKTLLAFAPSGIPRLGHIGIDRHVLGFSLAVAVGTGLLFGIVPALHAAGSNVHDVLKEGGGARGATRSSHTARRVLVAVQVMLAVVLASGAGLMLRSVLNLYGVDTGFRTDNVLTFELNPSASRYNTGESRVAFYDGLLEQIQAIPGVTSAGAVYSLPLTSGTNNWSILFEGRSVATVAEAQAARVQICTPGYFDALGLTLVRGRFFNEYDVADSPPVVVINETMARTHWPNEDPLGKRMKVYDERWPWLEVIGIVKDVRHYAVAQEPRTWWYVPYAQSHATAYYSPRSMYVAIRSETDAAPLVTQIRTIVEDYEASVPISSMRTMDQVFAGSIDSERFITVLLAVFGVLALFLASVGVYGVISYAVSLRTHEIGLRMALGAPGKKVLGQVVREGLVVSAIGIAVGLTGSLVLSRSFETMVFGITPTDPTTYAVVVGVLLAAAVGASLIPAHRASRVDPMVALRVEN